MVTINKPKIKWSKRALASLKSAYKHIYKDSPQSAEKVKSTIFKIVDKLPENPEKFNLDKFKKNNKGDYRAFEKYSLRVAYRHSSSEIKILRIRHVKREPKLY